MEELIDAILLAVNMAEAKQVPERWGLYHYGEVLYHLRLALKHAKQVSECVGGDAP